MLNFSQSKSLNLRPNCWSERDWSRFYEEYENYVARLALRWTGHGPHTAEIVQDVFCLAYRKREVLPYPEQTKTWLYRTTRYIALHCLRDRKRDLDRCIDYGDTPVSQVGEHIDKAESYSQQDFDRKLIQKCLARLSEDYRDALILVNLEGHNIKEASRISGTSYVAMRARHSRAKKEFLKIFQEERTQANFIEVNPCR